MKKIRKIRLELGLSQARLCQMARVNQTSLSRIESGKEPAFPKRGQRLADALGWEGSLEELFEDIEEEGDCDVR